MTKNTICKIKTCSRPVFASGLCREHYSEKTQAKKRSEYGYKYVLIFQRKTAAIRRQNIFQTNYNNFGSSRIDEKINLKKRIRELNKEIEEYNNELRIIRHEKDKERKQLKHNTKKDN